jgi:hypothetical protein
MPGFGKVTHAWSHMGWLLPPVLRLARRYEHDLRGISEASWWAEIRAGRV